MLSYKAQGILKRLAIFWVFAVFLFFLLRNIILEAAIHHLSTKIKKDYNAELNVKESYFEGFLTICINKLSVLTDPNDTIIQVDTIKITPSLFSLLILRIRINSLDINHARMNFICHEDSCNFKIFDSGFHTDIDTTKTERNYAELIHHLLRKTFTHTPVSINLSDINLNWNTDSLKTRLQLPTFILDHKQITGNLLDSSHTQQWKIVGNLDSREEQFQINFFSLYRGANIPLIGSLFHYEINFETLEFSLNKSSFSGKKLKLDGTISSTALSVFHKKISDDTVSIDNLVFDYRFNITKNSIQLDSSSRIILNDLSLYPFINFTNDKAREYLLNLQTDTIPSTAFFHSLPVGMFDATRDIKADGRLQYKLHFKLNSEEPDSLEFTSELKKERFRIKQLAAGNFYKINNEFEYTAYENDRPFRTFTVGSSNPDYASLNEISIYLRNAILTSEDGSFFFHNGFNEEAFKKSIAENYKKERFVRGGSTITMQLVKNVFLSRHKTIARKAEEALITWFIETNHICSKERMFEVYLNIIELGPNVYGVGEASRFYFNKKPSALTLSESIFIASLLPHPKWFKYSFDEQGNLKPYLAAYYRVVSNFMLRKNLINQSEYDAIQPNVKLEGSAKNIVIPSDTIPSEELE